VNGLARRQEYPPQPNLCGLKRKAVLLVEPNLDLRLLLNMLLTQDGCIVDACGSLIEALLAVSEKHFDLVITYETPEIDGLLLLQVLKEKGYATPSIVISDRYERESYFLAMNLGALDYFITPVDYAALQRVIHSRA
jgi:DNA-binding NtrC family response regulator